MDVTRWMKLKIILSEISSHKKTNTIEFQLYRVFTVVR